MVTFAQVVEGPITANKASFIASDAAQIVKALDPPKSVQTGAGFVGTASSTYRRVSSLKDLMDTVKNGNETTTWHKPK